MISDVYFPRVNGVSTSIATFRHSLQLAGCGTTLVAPAYPQAEPDADSDLIRVASRYLFMDPEDRLMHVSAVLALEARLRQQSFDLIHIHTPFAAHFAGTRLAARLGLPVVETYHTYFEAYFHHYLPWLPPRLLRYGARWLTRHQGRQLDALVVPSTAMRDVLCGYGVTTHIEIIPTGLDLDAFSVGDRPAFCYRHGIDPRRPTLVHIGRVAHEKNIGFLLRVVAQARQALPDILLLIAGEGPARAGLQKQVSALGLGDNCRFFGYFNRGQDLWDCYASGDAFVFASDTETQGLVLLEAMALGTPVISTAVLGTRDILDAGKGALVAQPEVDDFCQQVVRLLTDSALRSRLSDEGRAYARTWSTDRMAQRLSDFYRRIIQTGRRRNSHPRGEPK